MYQFRANFDLTYFRGSHQRCFIKKGVLKNFTNFTGKHLCWSFLLIKLQASGNRKLPVAASVIYWCCVTISFLCSFSIPFEITKKILKFPDDFGRYWKKTLEWSGLMLPWRVFHDVRTQPNTGFWNPTSPIFPCAHFGQLPPPRYDACIIFIATIPFTTT